MHGVASLPPHRLVRPLADLALLPPLNKRRLGRFQIQTRVSIIDSLSPPFVIGLDVLRHCRSVITLHNITYTYIVCMSMDPPHHRTNTKHTPTNTKTAAPSASTTRRSPSGPPAGQSKNRGKRSCPSPSAPRPPPPPRPSGSSHHRGSRKHRRGRRLS